MGLCRVETASVDSRHDRRGQDSVIVKGQQREGSSDPQELELRLLARQRAPSESKLSHVGELTRCALYGRASADLLI